MNSCSSSKRSSEDEHNFRTKISASKFLVLPFYSPPFNFVHSTAFFRQPLSLNHHNFQFMTDASNAAREVQKSITASVDKGLRMLQNLTSRNGVLDNIISLSSHLQSCCQTPRTNCQKLNMLSNQNFAAILPGDSVAGIVVANGILNFLNIYNTLLVVRLVLTWFPNAPPAVVSPLSTLCDPYLNIFRGIIPPLGGTLDLSPILAFLVLNAFTSTASALPAELPPTEVSKDLSVQTTPSHLTASQEKWMTRIAANKPTRSNDEI